MLLVFFVLCVAAVPSSMGQKVHERMSAEQVAQVFQSTHESVPEYEVVQFHVPHRNKRDLGALETLKATLFGNDIKLWLKPNEGVLAGENTPVFIAKKDPWSPKIVYKEIPAAMSSLGLVLEDPVKKATLLARTDARGQYSFNGYIGTENLVVRPLPESISNDLVQNSTSHNSESFEDSKSAYHVVFKREVKNEPFDHSKLAEQRGTGFQSMDGRIIPGTPTVVYPECMVVVDHSLFKMYNYNIENVLMYLLAFWNGVDLLYRSLDEPKFRFNIQSIVIGVETDSTPYLSQNMYSPTLIKAFPAHLDAQLYFYSIDDIFPVKSYDAVLIMTNIQMTDGNGQPNVLGIAQNGGMCGVNKKNKRVESVALTNDDGTFHGVATAAHEIAHLLGSSHDNDDHCKPLAGYIMAPSSGVTENAHDFSQCTITAIERFLRRSGGFCLYNEPKVTDPLPRGYLPGLLSSRDHQCGKMGQGPSCYVGPEHQLPCSAVYCYDRLRPKSCYQYKSQAPPDGAYCAVGKVCLHGKCVTL